MLGAALLAAQEYAAKATGGTDGGPSGGRADEDRLRVRPRRLPAQALSCSRRSRRARARADRPRHVTRPSRSTTPTPRAPRREAVRGGDAERAVVVCGSGAGVAVAACKVPGHPRRIAHDTYTAHQAVEHDDVNVLCLGARVIGPAYAAEIIARLRCGRVLGRGAPRAPAGEDRGDRARVLQRRLTWRRPASYEGDYLPIAEHGLVGDLHTVALVGTNGHDRLVLLPGVRLAERVRRDPRQGRGRLLRAPPERRRLDVQAALLPGHERPDHALLHARRRGRGAGLHADRGASRRCTATG